MNNFHDTLYAKCFEGNSKENINFLPSDFIVRLLLFENYILAGSRLFEVPQIIDTFGFESTLELIKSGKVSFNVENFVSFWNLGPYKARYFRGSKNLPLNSFLFESFHINPYESEYEKKFMNKKRYSEVQERLISNTLKDLDDIDGISSNQIKTLKREIASKIVHFRNKSSIHHIYKASAQNLELNSPIVRLSICQQVNKFTGKNYKPRDIKLDVKIASEIPLELEVDSNLESELGIDKEHCHNVLQNAMFLILRMNLRFIQMKEFNTQIAFREDEVNLFDENMRWMLTRNSETKLRDNFSRIIRVKALPELHTAIENSEIDLIKILEITSTQEWREFKNWLMNQEEINETELNDKINSLPQKIRDIYEKNSTQFVSWLSMTGLGIICPAASVSLGFLDKFLFDKFLPENKAITFINNRLPSIYRQETFNEKVKELHESEKIGIIQNDE